MGIDTGLYKFFYLLHILGVVVGIGAVMLNGMYAAKARALGGATGNAVRQVNFAVSNVAEKVIYSIIITGFALLGFSDKVFKMSQAWVWISVVLYIAAIGIAHAVMIPSTKELLAFEGGRSAEADALEKKLSIGGMALNLIIVVIIVLMIWKPGA